MSPIRLKIIVATVLAACALGGVAYAATFSAAKANTAYVDLAADTPGAQRFDLALGLRQTSGDVIDEQNTAVAVSRCDDCRAIAVAFQVVIVQRKGAPSDVRPQNLAVAYNEGCSDCSSLALAHQFVAGRGEPARLTESGVEQLYDVGRQLLRLERDFDDHTDAEIESRVAALAGKVKAILDRELVPIDKHGDDPDVDEDREVRRAA